MEIRLFKEAKHPLEKKILYRPLTGLGMLVFSLCALPPLGLEAELIKDYLGNKPQKEQYVETRVQENSRETNNIILGSNYSVL